MNTCGHFHITSCRLQTPCLKYCDSFVACGDLNYNPVGQSMDTITTSDHFTTANTEWVHNNCEGD